MKKRILTVIVVGVAVLLMSMFYYWNYGIIECVKSSALLAGTAMIALAISMMDAACPSKLLHLTQCSLHIAICVFALWAAEIIWYIPGNAMRIVFLIVTLLSNAILALQKE